MPIWGRSPNKASWVMPAARRLGEGFVEKGPLDQNLQVPKVSVGGDYTPEAFSPTSPCSPLHPSQPLEMGGTGAVSVLQTLSLCPCPAVPEAEPWPAHRGRPRGCC